MLFSFNLANPQTSLQIAHWVSFLSIMAKLHKIEQHLKKESLLKFNVKLKPNLTKRQSISKAKADPKPKMIKIQTKQKQKVSQSHGFLWV